MRWRVEKWRNSDNLSCGCSRPVARNTDNKDNGHGLSARNTDNNDNGHGLSARNTDNKDNADGQPAMYSHTIIYLRPTGRE